MGRRSGEEEWGGGDGERERGERGREGERGESGDNNISGQNLAQLLCTTQDAGLRKQVKQQQRDDA